MAGKVITVHARQRLPRYWNACVFLGGPSPEPDSPAVSWRAEIIALLRERWTSPGRLVVFVPRHDGRADYAADDLTDWHEYALGIADVAMFWWPDEGDQHVLPTTLAAWNDSQRAVHGAPAHAPHGQRLLRYAGSHGITTATTLSEMVGAALGRIGTGARRASGEREVPLPVWRTESFQRWHSAQTGAGNKLVSARLVWTFGGGPRRQPPIYWALHVQVYVSAEDRVKSNEVVISRPDISVVALYRRGATLDDSIVALVREFRSPASTRDGFVHELPGGSGNTGADAREQAAGETEEETGLAIDVRRLRAHGSRQLAATVSAHHAHLFTAELTDDELARLRASQSTPHGAGDTERTWIEVTTFGEIRENRLVDWATLGMITEALLGSTEPPPE